MNKFKNKSDILSYLGETIYNVFTDIYICKCLFSKTTLTET